jgi:DNA-binding transcriptional ArsR family regulator
MRAYKHKVNGLNVFNEIPAVALELVALRFRAMGEPVRLRILQALEGGETSVTALAKMIGTTQPNISKHLRVLQDAGLIGRRQEGSTVYYLICDPTLHELCEMVCVGVRNRLEAQVGAFAISKSRRVSRASDPGSD